MTFITAMTVIADCAFVFLGFLSLLRPAGIDKLSFVLYRIHELFLNFYYLFYLRLDLYRKNKIIDSNNLWISLFFLLTKLGNNIAKCICRFLLFWNLFYLGSLSKVYTPFENLLLGLWMKKRQKHCSSVIYYLVHLKSFLLFKCTCSIESFWYI